MSRTIVMLLLFFALVATLGIGLFAAQPGFMLAYLCLSPFIGIAIGRISIGVIIGKHALLNDDEAAALRNWRKHRGAEG